MNIEKDLCALLAGRCDDEEFVQIESVPGDGHEKESEVW